MTPPVGKSQAVLAQGTGTGRWARGQLQAAQRRGFPHGRGVRRGQPRGLGAWGRAPCHRPRRQCSGSQVPPPDSACGRCLSRAGGHLSPREGGRGGWDTRAPCSTDGSARTRGCRPPRAGDGEGPGDKLREAGGAGGPQGKPRPTGRTPPPAAATGWPPPGPGRTPRCSLLAGRGPVRGRAGGRPSPRRRPGLDAIAPRFDVVLAIARFCSEPTGTRRPAKDTDRQLHGGSCAGGKPVSPGSRAGVGARPDGYADASAVLGAGRGLRRGPTGSAFLAGGLSLTPQGCAPGGHEAAPTALAVPRSFPHPACSSPPAGRTKGTTPKVCGPHGACWPGGSSCPQGLLPQLDVSSFWADDHPRAGELEGPAPKLCVLGGRDEPLP